MKPQISIAESLRHGDDFLRAGSDSPRRDAEILLGAVLERDRAYLYAYGEQALDDTARDLFEHYLQRRAEGEPVAYILGKREFWSLLLTVNDSTLIPRADTETLVENALLLCQRRDAHVLDLGTGTGAIALALAVEHPDWQVEAVDVQEEAVDLAVLNAAQLQLQNVSVYRSDWFSAIAPEARFDLIVSNPPYIDSADPHLLRGDVRFEPRTALVAGDKGYAALFVIAHQARSFLKEGGWLLLEHGYQQAERVRNFLRDSGYDDIRTFTDFGGNDRVTAARWHAGSVVG